MLKISVIMPVYNGAIYIEETIKSVLNQTYSDFEFIIIDDGSTDDTLNILKKIHDNRIKILNQNHGGIVKALNLGIKESVGKYLIRIDADDVCLNNRFDRLLNYMETNTNVAICGSWANQINQKGEVVGKLNYTPIDNKEIKKYALLHNPFIHSSVIVCKEAINKVGMYRAFHHNEDYELWSRILVKYEGHNIDEALINYRVHSNQVTKKIIFK